MTANISLVSTRGWSTSFKWGLCEKSGEMMTLLLPVSTVCPVWKHPWAKLLLKKGSKKLHYLCRKWQSGTAPVGKEPTYSIWAWKLEQQTNPCPPNPAGQLREEVRSISRDDNQYTETYAHTGTHIRTCRHTCTLTHTQRHPLTHIYKHTHLRWIFFYFSKYFIAWLQLTTKTFQCTMFSPIQIMWLK